MSGKTFCQVKSSTTTNRLQSQPNLPKLKNDVLTSLFPSKITENCCCDGGCPRCTTTYQESPLGELQPVDAMDYEKQLDAGQPLAPDIKPEWEGKLNTDLSAVRIHTGTKAETLTRNLHARAFALNNHIVFNQGEFNPDTRSGRFVLGHELTHIRQQRTGQAPVSIQCLFDLDQDLYDFTLDQRRNAQPLISTNPDTYYYPAATGKNTTRTAFILAGIHGSERSAWELGAQAKQHLDANAPDFHTIIIPRVNPGSHRSSGSGQQREDDLNRAFGTGYTSANPNAARVTQVVNEFDPERTLSIHSITSATGVGIYLDPIHARLNLTVPQIQSMIQDPARPDLRNLESTLRARLRRQGITTAQQQDPIVYSLMLDRLSYPAITTASQRGQAFSGDIRNWLDMTLTEDMIDALPNPAANAPGNQPNSQMPASQFPTIPVMNLTFTSPYNLLYPNQGQVQQDPISLGEWLSGNGKTIITLELPHWGNLTGNDQSRLTQLAVYLPPVIEFVTF